MLEDELEGDLDALSSAEDFLDYFKIAYDPRVVQVSRLHILQRFHDYLAQVEEMPGAAGPRWSLYADLLSAAYQDFVVSDARTEKVFRVFRMHDPKVVAIPLDDLLVQIPDAAPI